MLHDMARPNLIVAMLHVLAASLLWYGCEKQSSPGQGNTPPQVPAAQSTSDSTNEVVRQEFITGSRLAMDGKLDEAIRHLQAALAACKEIDPKSELAGDCYFAIGIVRAKQNNIKDANDGFLAAYAIYASIPGTEKKQQRCRLANDKLMDQLVNIAMGENQTSGKPGVRTTVGSNKSIHEAAARGDLKQLETHLSEGSDVNVRDSNGDAPLHRAAIGGQVRATEYLLAHGAEADARDGGGYTPLHQAAMAGQVEVIELLLKRGANVNAKTLGTRSSPLHLAAARGEVLATKALILGGAEVDAVDTVSRSALSWAAEEGYIEIVKLLLRAKASVDNRTENSRYTPLHFAALKGKREVAILLLDSNAEVNAQTKNGQTPLALAIDKGHEEVAEVLRNRGGTE